MTAPAVAKARVLELLAKLYVDDFDNELHKQLIRRAA